MQNPLFCTACIVLLFQAEKKGIFLIFSYLIVFLCEPAKISTSQKITAFTGYILICKTQHGLLIIVNDCAKVLKYFQYLSAFQKPSTAKVIFKSDIFNVPKAFKTLVFAL